MRSTESWASHFVVSPIHSCSTENPLWTHPLRWMDAFAGVPDNRASLKAIFPVYMQTHQSAENTFDSPISSIKEGKKGQVFFVKNNGAYFILVSFGGCYWIPRQCFEFSSKWDEVILIAHLSKEAIVFFPCSLLALTLFLTPKHTHRHTYTHLCTNTHFCEVFHRHNHRHNELQLLTLTLTIPKNCSRGHRWDQSAVLRVSSGPVGKLQNSAVVYFHGINHTTPLCHSSSVCFSSDIRVYKARFSEISCRWINAVSSSIWC